MLPRAGLVRQDVCADHVDLVAEGQAGYGWGSRVGRAVLHRLAGRGRGRLRQVLAEGVTFRGPLGTAEGRDECIAGDAPHYRVHQAQAQPKHCEAG